MLTTNGKPTRRMINGLASQASGESSDANEILTRPSTPNTSLEQRMSLIRDTMGDQDLQISDDPNVAISQRQAKSTI